MKSIWEIPGLAEHNCSSISRWGAMHNYAIRAGVFYTEMFIFVIWRRNFFTLRLGQSR